ncbi:MAG: alcohol dehydrogenase catalytic domain-containing protein [Bacteroidetes bacterium]|nr:alcohol dehydrogenase catalytic domain-containing protein [Bacteroidota bacterium]
MKAALLTEPGKFEIRQLPDPKIENDTDVLIRVKTVGVCGSDMHYYTTGRIGSQVVKYPFIVGHEAAGVVEKTGNGVTRVKPGQRIAIDPAVSCGKCDQCKSGRENTCRKLRFLGAPQQPDGAQCEYVVLGVRNFSRKRRTVSSSVFMRRDESLLGCERKGSIRRVPSRAIQLSVSMLHCRTKYGICSFPR